jgi:hypothetical protein
MPGKRDSRAPSSAFGTFSPREKAISRGHRPWSPLEGPSDVHSAAWPQPKPTPKPQRHRDHRGSQREERVGRVFARRAEIRTGKRDTRVPSSAFGTFSPREKAIRSWPSLVVFLRKTFPTLPGKIRESPHPPSAPSPRGRRLFSRGHRPWSYSGRPFRCSQRGVAATKTYTKTTEAQRGGAATKRGLRAPFCRWRSSSRRCSSGRARGVVNPLPEGEGSISAHSCPARQRSGRVGSRVSFATKIFAPRHESTR